MVVNQCLQNYKMSEKEIKVPNIGEFKEVEVIEVLVSNGQSVSKNDPLITIESDKSSVEIPSIFEGKIKSINIKVGDKVSEGDTILSLEVYKESETKEVIQTQPKNEKKEAKVQTKKEKIINDKTKQYFIKNVSHFSVASPKARKFARELGVDINKISGSQRQGRVIESDIKNFISNVISKPTEEKKTKPQKVKSEFSHSDFGEVEIKDIPRVKKLASTYLVIPGQQYLM